METSFPIPSTLQDLERPPFNLLPYPCGFEDYDEATRADSFDQLVLLIERGNRTLRCGAMALFETTFEEDGLSKWNDDERIQSLYTLVRKSSSLALTTKTRFVTALCEAVETLCRILASSSLSEENLNQEVNQELFCGLKAVSQDFRDAFACHIYMLYSIMFIGESEAKVGHSLCNLALKNRTPNKKEATKREKELKVEAENLVNSREECACAMLAAAQSMASYKSKLWARGVPDENVIGLPCRIAYQMLERATGAMARKASCSDSAMQIIASTVNSTDCLLSTIVAALLDLLHSYEHMAPIVAEICCLVSDKPTNKLAVEIIREVGHLDTRDIPVSDAGGKASGLKNVAPILSELSTRKPVIILEHINYVLHHLDRDCYNLRSSVLTAIGNILVRRNSKEERNLDISDENSINLSNDGLEDDINKEVKKSEQREKLFDILTKHVHDVSSYTRNAVLKSWAHLVENQSVPVQRLIPVTLLAIDRLQDKTVLVRRSAMQLLRLLLENNPFTDLLNPEPYQHKMIEIKSYILDNLPDHIKSAATLSLKELGDDLVDSKERDEIENAAILAVGDEYDGLTDMSDKENDLSTKLKGLHFLRAALQFIHVFESATSAFESMLLSSNTSDVTEALRFFVRARHFQLPCAINGIKHALSLMWSNEKTIQDEVLNAFIEVFISIPGTGGNELLPSNVIADNILFLVGKASVSELASIEEAICRLVRDELIPADVFLILWSIVAKSKGNVRPAAILTLAMGASADPNIVDSSSRLRCLLDAGLGEHTEQNRDWKTCRSVSIALQRIARVKPDPNSAKSIVIEQILERLCTVIQGDWCDDLIVIDTLAWFGAAEQAIDAVFIISPEPESVCRQIIQAIEGITFGFSHKTPNHSCHSLRLSRFFFVISHIALKLLVYTEELGSYVRLANGAKTFSNQESVDEAKANSRLEGANNEDNDGGIESEFGVAQAEEAKTESQVAEIIEEEIIGRGMISLFTPLLVHIVADKSNQFSSPVLMQSSMLALCKFMCISSVFCEKHLPLLFSSLANAPEKDVTLRANTVIALGDLAFRFPNEVEPYTPRLYACLRDKSTRVRKHTLMVLTHLILNDMVKVKGQVCEVALCLEDNEVRIRDMARLLFHELSKRSNNPIYNLLPDIISRLSQMPIRKDQFRSIMAFLLCFIKKEKQNEMLVGKLCQRFPKCTSISQKADIAFCLSHLKMNQKCIKIFNDLFKYYKDALFDEDVFRSFANIVSKVKKVVNKSELKESLDEWESKLNKQSEESLAHEHADSKVRFTKECALKVGRNLNLSSSHNMISYEGAMNEEHYELEKYYDLDGDVLVKLPKCVDEDSHDSISIKRKIISFKVQKNILNLAVG